MIPSIPAKPTRYKGVQYRSRLEAGWAVFWDVLFSQSYPCPCGCQNTITARVSYEDFTTQEGHDFRGGWTPAGPHEESLTAELNHYCPDFRIQLCTLNTNLPHDTNPSYIFFQEVKPVFPADGYVTVLRHIQAGIGEHGYSLVLSVGSMREETLPAFYAYPYNPSHILFGSWFKQLGHPFIRRKHLVDAYSAARNFRWDLYRGP